MGRPVPALKQLCRQRLDSKPAIVPIDFAVRRFASPPHDTKNPTLFPLDCLSPWWDHPIMKLIADSRGRLAARDIFRPGKAFDVTPQPDGSIRVMELVEKEVPVVPIKFNKDGSFACPRLMTRRQICQAIRADRDAR